MPPFPIPVVVELKLFVSKSGGLYQFQVAKSPNPEVGELAMDTVKNSWRFLPAVSKGACGRCQPDTPGDVSEVGSPADRGIAGIRPCSCPHADHATVVCEETPCACSVGYRIRRYCEGVILLADLKRVPAPGPRRQLRVDQICRSEFARDQRSCPLPVVLE